MNNRAMKDDTDKEHAAHSKNTDKADKSPNRPEKTPNDLEKTPYDPVKTPNDPEKTPNDPVKTPNDPVKTPNDPEKTPNDQVKTPNRPEKSPNRPEKSPNRPEKSPNRPEKTPNDPEKKPNDLVKTPNRPEKSPNQPAKSPANPSNQYKILNEQQKEKNEEQKTKSEHLEVQIEGQKVLNKPREVQIQPRKVQIQLQKVPIELDKALIEQPKVQSVPQKVQAEQPKVQIEQPKVLSDEKKVQIEQRKVHIKLPIVQSVPQKVQNEPQRSSNEQRNVRSVSQKASNEQQNVRSVSQKVSNEQQNVRSVSQKVPNEPQKVQSEQQKGPNEQHKVRSVSQKVPNVSQKVSNEQQKVQSEQQKGPNRSVSRHLSQLVQSVSQKLSSEPQKVEHQKVQSDHQKVQSDNQKVQSDNQKVQSDHQKVQSDNQKVQNEQDKVHSVFQKVRNVPQKLRHLSQVIQIVSQKVPMEQHKMRSVSQEVRRVSQKVQRMSEKERSKPQRGLIEQIKVISESQLELKSDKTAAESQQSKNIEKTDNVSGSVFSDLETNDRNNFGCFFNDGKRRVDYVLVWEDHDDGKSEKSEQQHAAYRQKFEESLIDAGLEIEKETSLGTKKKIHFVKLYVSWNTMCSYAEYLGFRAPIERMKPFKTAHRLSQRVRKTIQNLSPLALEIPNQHSRFVTTAFSSIKLKNVLNKANHDAYFRPTQRIEVAHDILGTLCYGRKDLFEVGLDRMLKKGIYSSAFPPHEGPYEADPNAPAKDLNNRQILHNYWARWNLWFKYQPLDHIRDYYGEKIAFYFTFLGYYTTWLVPASIMGVFVFLYGFYAVDDNPIVNESCGSGTTFKMCPICDERKSEDSKGTCGYWYLSDICSYIKAAYLFDNDSTVVYSIFVSFWARTFLEHWKRSSSAQAYHWDVYDFVEVQERPRPEYSANCTQYAKDPVTETMEPFFPFNERLPRLILGVLSVIFMMLLSTASLVIMLISRSLLLDHLFQSESLGSKALTIANILSGLINLMLVLALEIVYENWAVSITEWEMHRTQTQFENNLIMKVFIFELFNHYLSIAYTALIKGHIAGKPGSYSYLLGKRLAECSHGGCMLEVTQVLAIITIGKQLVLNVIEVAKPKIISIMYRLNTGFKKTDQTVKQWEDDYNLPSYMFEKGLFMEYLEIIMQFGFITVFVPAFPLAPLFALINNIVEIRIDARKLVRNTQRPLPERSQGIGVWFSMLEFLVTLGTVSNALLISFTSEFLPTLLYRLSNGNSLKGYKNFTLSWAPANTTHQPCRYSNLYSGDTPYSAYYWKLLSIRLTFALVYQQVVVTLSHLINYLIPDITTELDLKIRRQKYLAKRAMGDIESQSRKV